MLVTDAKPSYTDRWGKMVVPGGRSVLKKRRGVFAALVSGSFLLVTHMPGYEQPELPGGGIDEGESPFEALLREVYEEAGLTLSVSEPAPVLEQRVLFYAEDTDQFLDYHQSYYLLEGPDIDACFFEGERNAPEHERVSWRLVEKIKNADFQHIHKKALITMGIFG